MLLMCCPLCARSGRLLTDYDALADFIPALAVSERLQHPSGDANLVRLRQVLLYGSHPKERCYAACQPSNMRNTTPAKAAIPENTARYPAASRHSTGLLQWL